MMFQWYNVENPEIMGYELVGKYSDKTYFEGTEDECMKFAEENEIIVEKEL